MRVFKGAFQNFGAASPETFRNQRCVFKPRAGVAFRVQANIFQRGFEQVEFVVFRGRGEERGDELAGQFFFGIFGEHFERGQARGAARGAQHGDVVVGSEHVRAFFYDSRGFRSDRSVRVSHHAEQVFFAPLLFARGDKFNEHGLGVCVRRFHGVVEERDAFVVFDVQKDIGRKIAYEVVRRINVGDEF
ncbi:MAG: hypothetical protein ACD_47C00026G0001 [uncultured bacterium]|nr:MAG: hypothetical protein ACD_47C00026G0001 [uncultured bacterium]